jgi:hypothetical protein
MFQLTLAFWVFQYTISYIFMKHAVPQRYSHNCRGPNRKSLRLLIKVNKIGREADNSSIGRTQTTAWVSFGPPPGLGR